MSENLVNGSFREKINSCDFATAGSRKQIYNSCKSISKYVNIDLTKQTKEQLIESIHKFTSYANSSNDYRRFKFCNKEIKLDNEQHEIVISPVNQNIRICAAAGSGKTTTILCRIKYLIDKYVVPTKILLLTFNVEAAQNLRNRIKELIGFDICVYIYTIDAFCNHIIHKYGNGIHNNIKNYSLSELSVDGLEIMRKHSKEISSRYKFIFFDEFQDVNDAQFNILKIFAENGCYLTIIGDDNQNIYQWRGTNNYYIINFDILVKNVKTYMITTNYRSNAAIVKIANDSIKYNKNRVMDKIMRNSKDIECKMIPELRLYNSKYKQFEFIINKINKFKDEGYEYDDICILSRNSYYLKVAEEYLQKENIPFISLLTDKNGDDNKSSIKKGMLTVSTIHRAKGLEWEIVFMVGLGDYFFPCHMNNNLKNIEEERRLFYVGITRPKQYLYFVENRAQLPLSRFIKEIYDELNFKNFSKIKKGFFEINDKTDNKLIYPITDIVKLFQGTDIKKLRELKLIPEESITKDLFEDIYMFNDQIKFNCLEADFGDFCDRVITRQILLNLNNKSNKQRIRDYDTEFIINSTILNEEEMEVYNEYDLMSIVLQLVEDNKKQINEINKDEFIKEDDLKKIISDPKKIKIAMNVCNKINPLYDVVRDNTYPKPFMNTLKQAYQLYTNSGQANEQIMKSIYYVSLCRRFNGDRRRLLYRDVFNVFMKNFDPIYDRIKKYAEMLKDHKTICKTIIQYIFRLEKDSVRICGEIDMIDISDNIIIDFKCSDSEDCKLDWIIQTLLYYSILMENQNIIQKDMSKIKKIGIFNIMNGKQYEFNIPENYNRKAMIEFSKGLIEKDIKNERDHNIEVIDLISLETNNSIENEQIYDIIEIEKNPNPINYICFDVEIGDYDDIIQLAYEIYDDKLNLKKSFNKYIKSKLLINKFYSIHKIDTKKLQSQGYAFRDVISEFLRDLNDAKYVIGHNIRTDISHIINDMERHNIILNNGENPFDNKIIECTMKLGTPICQLKNKSRKRLKPPKLEELYEYLYHRKMQNAHNALYDVKYTWECYIKLKENVKTKNHNSNKKSFTIEDFLK